ncbi:MAG TPA: CotH kinase family protein, partial [Planctomycetota bacterium]|nr:CotH kinase family protein [Planctomycetota bacterium]
IFLYKMPADGRYTFVVWDRDQAFWDAHTDSITQNFERRILTNNLIVRNPARMARYREILREIMNGPAHPDVLGPQLEAVIAQIKDAAYADPYRKLSPTPQELEWEWDDVRRRIPAKHAAVMGQLGP